MSRQQEEKEAGQGERSGLGPCVHTLGAQPVISLSWGAKMAFPAFPTPLEPGPALLWMRCGHMVGIHIFCLGELGYISLRLIYTAANLSN